VVMTSLKNISNVELINRLKSLVKQEQHLTLNILPHLIEVERRKLYLDLGFRSLYDYCTRELKYSESGAIRRIYAARAIEKCPTAMEYLVKGLVNLSALSLTWKYVTPELLGRISSKSKREVEAIVAEFNVGLHVKDRTKPVVVERIVKQSTGTQPQKAAGECKEIYRRSGGKLFASADNSTPQMKEEVVRQNVTMHDVRCFIDDDVMQQLERCKKLLSGKFPQGLDYNKLMRELAAEWLNRHDPVKRVERRDAAKRRSGGVAKSMRNSEYTRHSPVAVRDAVFKRDGGKCTFVGSNGKRCNSDYNLQYDHFPIPYALGGPSTVKNLRLLCAKHNRYSAEKVYGATHVRKFYLKEPGNEFAVKAGKYPRDIRSMPPGRSKSACACPSERTDPAGPHPTACKHAALLRATPRFYNKGGLFRDLPRCAWVRELLLLRGFHSPRFRIVPISRVCPSIAAKEDHVKRITQSLCHQKSWIVRAP